MFIMDLTSANHFLLPSGPEDTINFVEYMIRVLTVSMGISLVTTLVLYILMLALMKKKLDLN